jgi:SRSO17 transposase
MQAQTLQRKLSRTNVERQLFLQRFQADLTHRKDGSCWPRSANTYRVASHYFEALLTPGPRKSMRNLAKRVSIDRDRVERFIRESPWEPDAVQDHVRRAIPKTIRDPDAVIVIDDFGIAKQGTHSVGVQRQYSGTLGKTGNCQVAVNLTYCAPAKGQNKNQRTWPLGTELYLPQAWVESDDFENLRQEVRLPPETRFRTKHEIALGLLEKAWAMGVKAAAIISDAEYGGQNVRGCLRERHQPYALGVRPSHAYFIDPNAPLTQGRNDVLHYAESVTCANAKRIAQRIQRWSTITWGEGTKGPLTGRFARIRVRATELDRASRRATDEVGWLLLEQRRNELKAYVCWGLDEKTLTELVATVHLRWTIEQYHKEAKQLLGLDRFEGRTWRGWHKHVALVLLAYAFLATLRADGNAEADLPPLRQVAKALLTEATAQEFLRNHRLDKEQARALATTGVRYLTDL